jgi:phage terminase large subunit GpA-like protein
LNSPLRTLARDTLSPRPPLACWDWHLTYVASAKPSEGDRPWSARRALIFKHWLAIATARLSGVSPAHDPAAHLAEEIWIVAGSQCGKDRGFLNAICGYAIDAYPRDIGYFMPRHRDLSKLLRGRVKPLIERTPRLARHLPRSESARADALTNSLLIIGAAKVYPLAGSVANDLRSTPLELELWNEFDILPPIIQEEGNPIELGLDRMKSHPRDRLAAGATTPTLIDGHGWKRLNTGSHERLMMACHQCGAHAWLDPAHIRAVRLVADVEPAPGDILAGDLARWHCPRCEHPHTTEDKDAMVAAACAHDGFTRHGGWVSGTWTVNQDFPDGHWTPAATMDDAGRITAIAAITSSVRSGWMNSLYSLDISLGRFLHHALVSKATGEDEWRTHCNTWSAEPFLPRVEPAPSTESITANCGDTYPHFSCPPGAQKVVIACDQQGNQIDLCWFPYEVRGVGTAGETWLIAAGEVHGWDELELLEKKQWNVGGKMIEADAIGLDGANGTMRVRIQTWAAANPAKRLVLRGVQTLPAPWIERKVTQSRERRNKRIVAGARVYSFDSTGWKNELDARIRRTKNAAGEVTVAPWHLPIDVPDFYLQSLTAEERILAQVLLPGEGRRPMLVWRPRAIYDARGDLNYRSDNHWWDASVMSLVIIDIKRWSNLDPITAEPETAPPPQASTAGDWVDTRGWE